MIVAALGVVLAIAIAGTALIVLAACSLSSSIDQEIERRKEDL